MDWQDFLRGAYRSRTLWASALMAVVGVIETQTQSIARLLPRVTYAHVMIGCAAIMGILRILTIDSLIQKGGGDGQHAAAGDRADHCPQCGRPADGGIAAHDIAED